MAIESRPRCRRTFSRAQRSSRVQGPRPPEVAGAGAVKTKVMASISRAVSAEVFIRVSLRLSGCYLMRESEPQREIRHARCKEARGRGESGRNLGLDGGGHWSGEYESDERSDDVLISGARGLAAVHVGPEGREEQRLPGYRLDLEILGVEGRLAPVRHRIEIDDHGELTLPAAWSERIEVPVEMACISPVVLDLVSRARERRDLQRRELRADVLHHGGHGGVQLGEYRLPHPLGLDPEVGAYLHVGFELPLATGACREARVLARILLVELDAPAAQLRREQVLHMEDAVAAEGDFHRAVRIVIFGLL